MSKKIWAVLQHRQGALHRTSREAIAAAQQLAATFGGGEVSAVVLAADASALAPQVGDVDLAAVLTVEAPALAGYTPGAYCDALAAAVAAESPDVLVFPHTYQTVDYAPRLAERIDAAVVPEAVSFESSDAGPVFRRPVLGGKLQARVRVKGEGRIVVTVQSGAFPADTATAGSAEARAVAVDAAAITADREILGVEAAAEGDTVDLTKADIIVSAGRGVGGEDKMGPIHDLAAALGADVGASRPVIDNGWLPRDRQIGSSGQTVAPKLYIACGISGAIQHLVGMKGSTCIVTINKDPSAPLFALSDYGIVGDLHEVLPALTEAVKAAKG